jgi:hypothetical protein
LFPLYLSSQKIVSVLFALAAVDAYFVAVDDAHVLMILRLHFAELRIALFTVSFPVFVVIIKIPPFNNRRRILCIDKPEFIRRRCLMLKARMFEIPKNR